MPEKRTIECAFSLFDEGRTYTGNHRKYLLENAQDVAISAATQERIKLREALGFYGHGRRVIAGKVHIGEVEAVTLPDGTKSIITNVPSNVTTSLIVESDGMVRHTQEILDTEEGRIVAALNDSKIGGFSWACPGSDGGHSRPSRLSGFAGMDYVHMPNFSSNRGYMLEGVEAGGVDRGMVLESVAAIVGDDAKAEALVTDWLDDARYKAILLEDALVAQEAREVMLLEQLQGKEKAYSDLTEANKAALAAQESYKKGTAEMVKMLLESAPFFIPETAMHALLEGDFSRAKGIFEAAKSVEFGTLPLKVAMNRKSETIRQGEKKAPAYGTAETAWTL